MLLKRNLRFLLSLCHIFRMERFIISRHLRIISFLVVFFFHFSTTQYQSRIVLFCMSCSFSLSFIILRMSKTFFFCIFVKRLHFFSSQLNVDINFICVICGTQNLCRWVGGNKSKNSFIQRLSVFYSQFNFSSAKRIEFENFDKIHSTVKK